MFLLVRSVISDSWPVAPPAVMSLLERRPQMHPNKLNFVEGLDLVLERWVAFKMALEMEWGGHGTAQKAQEFKEGLVDYFERGSLHSPLVFKLLTI